MSNQLHLSLLFWIIDYQKIIIYSNKFFIIFDKHFHTYYEPYCGWKTSSLATIKNFAGYW